VLYNGSLELEAAGTRSESTLLCGETSFPHDYPHGPSLASPFEIRMLGGWVFRSRL